MNLQRHDDVDAALRSPGLSVRELYRIWEQREPVKDPAKPKAAASAGTAEAIPWMQSDLSLALQFTKRALAAEEYLLTCDAAREALWLERQASGDQWKDLVYLRLDYAQALTRLGRTRQARAELLPYVRDDFQPPLFWKLKREFLLGLGDIVREESHMAAAKAARLQMAEQALGYYEEALALEPDYLRALVYAAAAGLIAAEREPALRERAQERARQILGLTAQLEDTRGPEVGSVTARAAAHVILGQVDEAAAAYRELGRLSGVTTAHLAETRYRTRFLAEAIGLPPDTFKPAFPPLQLIVFSGHRANISPQGAVRFTPETIAAAREQLRAKLDQLQARAGLAGADSGGDLLFDEAMLDRPGATLHLVLPWSQEEFRSTNVRPYETPGAPAPVWEPLFDRALGKAATVRELGEAYALDSDVSWHYTMEVIAGLALHIAKASRLDVVPLALWDGVPTGRAGGTASFVDFWSNTLKREVVKLQLPEAPPAQCSVVRRPRVQRETLKHEVKSMLFADIVGYSKLNEQAIPHFVGSFLERVSQVLSASKHAPQTLNTWGDAIYAVFNFAEEAARFALELSEMVEQGKDDWLKAGLFYWEVGAEGGLEKRPLSLRIGLHTGPVFMHSDPVVRRLGFTGAHVTRAARIEPVTKTGEIYGSEEFAALVELGVEVRRCEEEAGATLDIKGFACEYAATKPLAKGYRGEYRLYRVLPQRVLEIEELARAAHALYCEEARERPGTPPHTALLSWEELTEDLRDANRAQVADIPNKLRALDYELTLVGGEPASQMTIPAAKLEELAIREHDRWMKERRRQGWSYGPVRDNERKLHPLLVSWEELSRENKDKDRDVVRHLPKLIKLSGFRLRRTGAE